MIYLGRGLRGEGDSDGAKEGGGVRMEREVLKEGSEGMRRKRTCSKTCCRHTSLLPPPFPWMLI